MSVLVVGPTVIDPAGASFGSAVGLCHPICNPSDVGRRKARDQVDTHDDEGRVTDEWVIYPYSDDDVEEAVLGDGTPVSWIWED